MTRYNPDRTIVAVEDIADWPAAIEKVASEQALAAITSVPLAEAARLQLIRRDNGNYAVAPLSLPEAIVDLTRLACFYSVEPNTVDAIGDLQLRIAHEATKACTPAIDAVRIEPFNTLPSLLCLYVAQGEGTLWLHRIKYTNRAMVKDTLATKQQQPLGRWAISVPVQRGDMVAFSAGGKAPTTSGRKHPVRYPVGHALRGDSSLLALALNARDFTPPAGRRRW
jgi:hypothetical protein